MNRQPTNPNFIWISSDGRGRSQVALFRRNFTLGEAPTEAFLHLFADTRYRLLVNGQTLGHGPARFHTSHPEHDSWDVAPYLTEGENIVAVLVHSMGRESFTNESSIGGFVAWGQIGEISLGTETGWKAIAAHSYRNDTTRLSNQLGFHESLDARKLPADWAGLKFDDSLWPSAVALTNPSHWGELQTRSIPYLNENEVAPVALLQTFAIENHEPAQQVLGLRITTESDFGWPVLPIPIALLTYLYSPRQQTVNISASLSKIWVNGQDVPTQESTDLPWRIDYSVSLNEGWNPFLALDQRLGDSMEVAIQWPEQAGIVASVSRDLNAEPTFQFASKPVDESKKFAVDHQGQLDTDYLNSALEFPSPELLKALSEADFNAVSELTCEWAIQIALNEFPSAFAARAWEKLVPLSEASNTDGSRVLLYDFGIEVLGRPHLKFTAAEGTIVDLLYTERLADGVAKHWMQGTRMGERYIAREGKQTWHTIHPHGMRYLEVVVRGDVNQFQLHHIALTGANYPVLPIGSFSCSDETLTKIWKVGADTLAVCMEDAYLDCPWRERGVYTGDLLVHFYINLATFGDYALARRSIIQLFETQNPQTGLLACTGHGLEAGLLPDYSVLMVQVLWHYWARTGDLEFVRGLEPQLRSLLAGLEHIEVPDLNLFDTSGHSPYIDLSHIDTDGINCAANCYHQRAFSDGARLLDLLGDQQTAAQYEQHAEKVAVAIRASFWNDEFNAFVDRRIEDVPTTDPSTPGNTLPLLYGIASPEQVEGAVAYLAKCAARNERVPNPQVTADLNFTSYFAFHGLSALYQNDQIVLAEHFIRENWGKMLDKGATTWWEYFIDHWSLCHAWSAAPTHYLSSQVLGVRYTTPGVPDEIIIDPQPGTLQWANGIYPHPHGPIAVEWKKVGDKIVLNYHVPEGVHVMSKSK